MPSRCSEVDPEDRTELLSLTKVIGEYLRGRKREARIIFVMRYYFCDSIKAIASFLGVSESKVKSSLFRTRKGLLCVLEEQGWVL